MITTNDQSTPVGLTADELRALLDALDRVPGISPDPGRRRHPRTPYRSRRVRIHVLDDSGDVTGSFQVSTRNISARGLAFVRNQMLAVGQRLMMELPLIDDQLVTIPARVVRCRHLKGMLHEVGVEFVGRPAKTA